MFKNYPEVSLRHFARLTGVAYWRLRDFIAGQANRRERQHKESVLRAAVKRVALAHPTYGYRRVHQELAASDFTIGLHAIRKLLRELNLVPEPHRARRPKSRFTPEIEYPPGRRVQIDATQVKLASSKSWVYLVQDVSSRALLEIHATRALSKFTATEVLRRGIERLRGQGVTEAIIVQSDGGSDFTSIAFQEYCRTVGTWIRSKVSVKGGMGILERLNRTFKYDFCFREEHATLSQLRDITKRFETWYNRERLHSAIGYRTPWAVLAGPGILT